MEGQRSIKFHYLQSHSVQSHSQNSLFKDKNEAGYNVRNVACRTETYFTASVWRWKAPNTSREYQYWTTACCTVTENRNTSGEATAKPLQSLQAGVQCCWMNETTLYTSSTADALHWCVILTHMLHWSDLMLQILMHKGKRSQFLYCSYMNYRGKRYETVSDVTTTNYRRGWAPPGCASSKCQKCVCAHHVLHTFTLFNHVLVKLYWPTRNIWHHAQCKFRCVETGEVFLSESSTDNWCAYNLKFVLEVGQ